MLDGEYMPCGHFTGTDPEGRRSMSYAIVENQSNENHHEPPGDDEKRPSPPLSQG